MNFWYNFSVCRAVHKEVRCILTGAWNSLIIPLLFCEATVVSVVTVFTVFAVFTVVTVLTVVTSFTLHFFPCNHGEGQKKPVANCTPLCQ
jgi:hypothetical protein